MVTLKDVIGYLQAKTPEERRKKRESLGPGGRASGGGDGSPSPDDTPQQQPQPEEQKDEEEERGSPLFAKKEPGAIEPTSIVGKDKDANKQAGELGMPGAATTGVSDRGQPRTPPSRTEGQQQYIQHSREQQMLRGEERTPSPEPTVAPSPGDMAMREGEERSEALLSEFETEYQPKAQDLVQRRYDELTRAKGIELGMVYDPVKRTWIYTEESQRERFEEYSIEARQQAFEEGQTYYASAWESFDIENKMNQIYQDISDRLNSEAWGEYKKSPKGKREITAVAQSEHERLLKERHGHYAVAAVSILDIEAAEDIVRKKWESGKGVFDNLQLRTRISYAAGEAGLSALAYPVTLAQMGVKYITGEGSLTDPIGRIETGKTILLPDVSQALAERKITPTQGAISGSIGEGIAFATGKEGDFFKSAEKYPMETVFATGGEIVGLFTAGKAVQVGKVGAGKAYQRIGGPDVSSYMPGALIRKGYWKAKTRLGLAEYVPEEKVWHPEVLAGESKYAKLPGASKQLKAFEKTRDVSKSFSDDILSIHASPGKFHYITRVSKGASETPGLSVSAYGYGSPHFLRIGATQSSYRTTGISLFPKAKMPTAPLVKLSHVFRLPKRLRGLKPGETTQQFYGRAGGYMLKQPTGKYGFIAAKSEIGGGELEAVIRGGTWLKRGESFSWTTYKGHAVPLPKYSPIGKGVPDLAKGAGAVMFKSAKQIKEFVSPYSYGRSTVPIISAGYIASSITSAVSAPSIPSKPSMPSYTSKSMVSIPSSTISAVSSPSKPSKPSVVSIPSKPSTPSKPSASSIPSIPSIPAASSKPGAPGASSSIVVSSMVSKPSLSSMPGLSSTGKPVIPMYDDYAPSKKSGGPGFNVLVKDRVYQSGKKVYKERFVRANKKPLSENDAMSLGAHITDNSAAASFIIKPASGEAQPLRHNVMPWEASSHKFYRNKKGTFIERTTYRIDSSGEHQGITAKGLLARMNVQSTDRVSIGRSKKKTSKDVLSIGGFDIDLGTSKRTKAKSFDMKSIDVGFNKIQRRINRIGF